MNFRIALLGIIEILSAVSIGIFILALTYKLLKWVGKRYYDIQHGNLAFGIFMSAIMFSVGYMVNAVIQPLVSSFRLMSSDTNSIALFLKFFGQGAIYIGIAYTSAVLIGLISTFLYSRLTPIDEFEEIKNNNVGVALIVSSIIITLTMMSKGGVAMVIESIIPYPDLPPR